MYPGVWAAERPHEPAVIMAATDTVITWADLDARSNQVAHLLRDSGLQRGDHMAIVMDNDERFLEIAWAGLRSGLYVTAINWHLTADEASYIVNDCEAKVVFTTDAIAEVAAGMVEQTPNVRRRLMTGDAIEGHEALVPAIVDHPTTPIADESAGETMLYTSGSTGRPKGVLAHLPEVTPWQVSPDHPAVANVPNPYGFGTDTVYLSPAPLYHAAPLGFCRRVHFRGGALVVMDRFDARRALSTIERYGVTHSQWVPTMFVRLLEIPEEERATYDLSSHRCAIHAAAPCPVPVKQQMIEWWGPIIEEYYAGSEAVGATRITSEEWLAHPGSVGKANGIAVLDENDDELPAGQEGAIHFIPIRSIEYKGDPDKTAEAHSKQGYVSIGDIGYVDDEGYLFLTDRKSFMVISGGVNIYPRESEDVLIMHPAVADVGVFGIPHPDLGETVHAAVQLQPGVEGTDELVEELLAYCREHLTTYKCPRTLDFHDELPRLPTGKLYKHQLRKPYWP